MSRVSPLLVLLIVGMLRAADPVSLDELFTRLGSEDFEQREAATAELMIRPDLDDARIAQGFRQATGPEYRHRLTRVAMHRYYAELRPSGDFREDEVGALGIDISKDNVVRPDQCPTLLHPALMITSTRPGFPAHAQLRPGDLITAIEGQTFDDNLDSMDFVQMVTQRRAGQAVEFTLLRDGRRMTIKIKLDSKRRVDDLNQMISAAGLDPMLYPGWQAKLATLLHSPHPSDQRIELVPAK